MATRRKMRQYEQDIDYVLKGVLAKKNSSGASGSRRWNNRFFLLTPTTLSYWASEQEYMRQPRKPKGTFYRSQIFAVNMPDDKGDTRFEFKYAEPKGDQLVELSASSGADLMNWVRELRQRVPNMREAESLAARAREADEMEKEINGLKGTVEMWQVKLMEADRKLEEESARASMHAPKVGEAQLKATMLQRKVDALETAYEEQEKIIHRLKAKLESLEDENAEWPRRIMRANEEIQRLEMESDVRQRIQDEAKHEFAALKPLLGCEFTEPMTGDGTVITSAKQGMPAAVAGLVEGDIVVGVANANVEDKMDFSHAISGYNPGDLVPVQIKRGRIRQTVMVELGSPGLTRREIRDLRRKAAGGVTPADVAEYIETRGL